MTIKNSRQSKAQARWKPIHRALMEGALSKLPAPPLMLDCAWGPESNERWNIALRPFCSNPAPPDADLVFAFCPKIVRAMSRPCITARPVGSCYARYSVQLSSTEFQPHRLASECIATKACTSFWFKGAFLASPKPTGRMTLLQDGSMHIFPCRQSFIGYVLAHGHTHRPFHGAAKHTYNH
jgi:hypothetical protein